VVLAVLAEVAAVGVDDGRAVVVDAGHLALVERDDHRHLVLLAQRLELLDRRAGNGLRGVVPALVLTGQKYGPLKISWRQRIWTPFLPASWIIGRCFSNIAAWTSATDFDSSLTGLLA
jgi:hypothetical protein